MYYYGMFQSFTHTNRCLISNWLITEINNNMFCNVAHRRYAAQYIKCQFSGHGLEKYGEMQTLCDCSVEESGM